jgi:P27 family predicted phage terminase small subunit
MSEIRMLATVDRAGLVGYCLSWSRMLEAERHLKAEGCVLPDGTLNSWYRVSKEAMTELRQSVAALGLSPSARSRIHMLGNPEAEADPMNLALKTRSERARAS